MQIIDAKDRPGHFLFWGLGGLFALLPYLIDLSGLGVHSVMPPGHYAENWLIGIRHFFISTTLGSWLWFLSQKVPIRPTIRSWWRSAKQVNWIWFGLTLLIYLVHNHLLISRLPFSTPEYLSVISGRFLTGLVVCSLIWFAAHLASLAAPTRLRLIPWIIPALIPAVLILDALSVIIWQNPLRHVINKLDEEGSIDLHRQLAAGDIEPASLILPGLLMLLVPLICYAAFHLSRKLRKINVRPLTLLVLIIAGWTFVFVERSVGLIWKSRKALRMEHRSYGLQLTQIEPEPGVASYQVSWLPATLPEFEAITTKPDVFVILLESTRADAIDAKHTPFLARFRDEECQPLGETWAASNGTHLSWYSIFNGQIPHHWGGQIALFRDGQDLSASPFIELLRTNGYRSEVRTVCDLSYLGMGATNFGSPPAVDLLVSAPVEGEFAKLPIPTRESKNLDEAMRSLSASSPGGSLHVLAFDSPHYSYHWPDHFEPPYTDFAKEASFGIYPGDEEIRRVRHRYYNSLAWADHEIARLVTHLKKIDRYDNSLIIVTGDHGEEFQEHGSWFHCSSLEKEQTAVPILIKWPEGTAAPPQKSASHLDLLPSLLDHLGVPSSGYAHLPGRSLLQSHPEPKTEIIMTAFCGISGIAMTWHRDGYTATFRWYQPWLINLPKTIHLDDITGPTGSLDLDNTEQWNRALQTHFPDAPDRLFSEFQR